MQIKTCALYVRVSTVNQGKSVDSQLVALREYARSRGIRIAREYVDNGISGRKSGRPALDQLMNAARKRQFDAVVVFRFDRFARSTRHLLAALEEFRNLGVAFISYNENIDTASPLGEAMFTICAALAKLEVDIVRERVRVGLAAARAKGRIGGRKKTRDDAAIARLRNGGVSIREIAKQLGISKGSVQAALAAAKGVY